METETKSDWNARGCGRIGWDAGSHVNEKAEKETAVGDGWMDLPAKVRWRLFGEKRPSEKPACGGDPGRRVGSRPELALPGAPDEQLNNPWIQLLDSG
ncbi:hypothetical protein A9F13_16g01353 [Clavispora lusitaniae]|uniref:Uncharacterized protein n=1 Tax=Clavispora lusitaniae TaxID=36911 RepID=A0AA91PWZ2_CLALS|nr:hypothetical protein A9F13_16g01353 [Clavispora lusitaniae]